MTLVLADRVLETCTAPGTGAVSLLGAITGYQTFSSTVGNGNTCYYTIADQNGANWEVGVGTYSSSGNTLARTTVLASSNGGSLTNFASGSQNVFLTYPAEKAVSTDTLAYPPAIGSTTPNTGAFTTLAASSTVTLSGGTANGVLYLNGSDVVTSGTGLVFDGTNLGIGTASPANRLDAYDSSAKAAILAHGYSVIGANANTNNGCVQVGANGSASLRLDYDAVSGGTGTAYLYNTYGGPLILGTSNTERMRIDSSGNVGIGTSSPSLKLNVKSSDYRAALFETSSNLGPSVQIKGSRIYELRSTDVGASEGGGLFFIYDKTAEVSRVTIDSSGNVGIGTISVTSGYKLDVAGIAGATNFDFRAAGSPLAGSAGIFAPAANTFGVYTAGSERMRIDSSGNVGIGTTSPGTYAAKLAVIDGYISSGVTSGSAYINWYSGSAAANQKFWRIGTGVGSLLFETVNDAYTTPSEKMRIDSSGNLLVGTTSALTPGSPGLSVQAGSTNATTYYPASFNGGAQTDIRSQSTTGVSTTATSILNSPEYFSFCLVFGSDGTNRFADVVLMSISTGTVNVISSLTASGAPAARTYSQSSSTLRVAMGSGTYTVRVSSIGIAGS